MGLKLKVGCSYFMTIERLIDIVTKLLETDSNLDFLSQLSKSEFETLVAVVRDRVEKFG